MNPEFEKASGELVEWITGAAKGGGDFVAEQAPLLAAEIVAWHFWSSVFLVLLWLAFAVPPFVLAALCYRWQKTAPNNDGDYSNPSSKGLYILFGTGLFAVSLVIAGAGAAPNGYEAVKAATAPRLVIIEYAGKALRSVK